MCKMIEAIYTPGDQAENLISTCRGAGYDEALVGSSKESGQNGLYFFFFKRIFKVFIYLFIFGCDGSSLLSRGLSLVAASGSFSLVVVRRLLVAVVSPPVEHRLHTGCRE